MNIKIRLRKIETKTIYGKVCQCPKNSLARSVSVFTEPIRCRACGWLIKPTAILVDDLSKLDNFDLPVKVYAGFNPDLV